jgi:excisionase family DNA binding protein
MFDPWQQWNPHDTARELVAPELLKIAQVTRHLKITEAATYDLIRVGHLRAVRVGARILRVSESAFAELLEHGASAARPDQAA